MRSALQSPHSALHNPRGALQNRGIRRGGVFVPMLSFSQGADQRPVLSTSASIFRDLRFFFGTSLLNKSQYWLSTSTASLSMILCIWTEIVTDVNVWTGYIQQQYFDPNSCFHSTPVVHGCCTATKHPLFLVMLKSPKLHRSVQVLCLCLSRSRLTNTLFLYLKVKFFVSDGTMYQVHLLAANENSCHSLNSRYCRIKLIFGYRLGDFVAGFLCLARPMLMIIYIMRMIMTTLMFVTMLIIVIIHHIYG